MVNLVGRSGELALFSNGSDAAVVNMDLNLVVGVGEHSVLSAVRDWRETDEVIPNSIIELAAGAVTTLDIKVITASAGRAYTIPDSVKAEAQKALEWRKEHKRGGTPVGLNTARTLARGGQIGIEKIRHIAKYFPRHEVDKKGKGWKPGQDSFPSNGRIAWALWGGDAAWRWARAIVERENKKAIAAGGYALPGYQDSLDTYKTVNDYDANIDAFKMAHTLDPEYGPEFMARVCLDGSGIDRLYKVDHDGKVCVWDGRGWDDMGHVDGDVWSYDRALDDPYDHVEKDHFIIDPESAIAISAMLQENPFGKVTLEDIDPEEAMLVAEGLPEEDFQMMDYALTAAGDSMSGSKPTGAVKAGDGQYTSAERSTIAKSAPRDATGKFAKTGGRAVVGNNAATGAGTIVGRSKTPGNILFKKDSDGQTIDVPAKYSTPEDQFKAPPAPVQTGKPLDTSGILAEPRTPNDMPGAHLKGTLPPMTQQDMQGLLNDWPSYVQKQRESFTPTTEQDARDYAKRTGQKVREVPTTTRTPISTFKDGQIVRQDVKPPQDNGGGSGGGSRDKTRETLEGLKDRTKYEQKLFTPAPKAPSRPAPVPPQNSAKPGWQNLPKGVGPRSGINWGQLDKKRGSTVNPSSGNGSGRGGAKPAKPAPYVSRGNGSGRGGAKPMKPKSGFGYGPMAKGRPRPGFDNKGRYVVQKGDNLWSISDRYKPKGQTTAQYWNKVLDANKGRYKSGNPNLIYSGERINLPGVYSPTKREAPKSGFGYGPMAKGKKPTNPGGSQGTRPTRPTKPTRPSLPKSGFGYGPMAKGQKPTNPGGSKIATPARPAAPTKPTRPSLPKSGFGYGPMAKGQKPTNPGGAKTVPPTRPTASKRPTRPVPSRYGKSGFGQGAMARGKARPGFDDKGRYIVQKGDSLWSIADKHKPAGEKTAPYWSKVMKANPKENFKSGNPSLIYSGERVKLPGVYSPVKPQKTKTPGEIANEKARISGQARQAAEAKAKSDAAKQANERARTSGQARQAAEAKQSKIAQGFNERAKQSGQARQAAEAKAKSDAAKQANEKARVSGQARQAAEAKQKEAARQANERAKTSGQTRQAAESKAKSDAAKQSNERAKQSGQTRQAAEAKQKETARQSNERAKVSGQTRQAAEAKAKSDSARQSNERAKTSGQTRQASEAKQKESARQANETAKVSGQTRQAAEARAQSDAARQSNEKAKVSGQTRQASEAKQRDLARQANEKARVSGEARKAAQKKVVPSRATRPAPVAFSIVPKRGKSGARKRKLSEG